jgi:hypothetical protein
MSSHNKFLSFLNNTSTATNSSSTFIVESESKILSIEIKATDELIDLPDPATSKYNQIQYLKRIDTPRDIIFQYNGLQKGKIYNHRMQTIVFFKFIPDAGQSTWIV